MKAATMFCYALIMLGMLAVIDAKKTGRLRIVNITYQQPFSGFILVVHNRRAAPLFKLGERASRRLQELAENGNPGRLERFYNNRGSKGVFEVKTLGPLGPGESMMVEYTIDAAYPYVSIASMFVNSNDGIVAANGAMFVPRNMYFFPGYDAGTEVNNELCSSIPGPACPGDSGNARDGGGEGFVHIHRGIHGVGDLNEANTDWRNPMMAIEVLRSERS